MKAVARNEKGKVVATDKLRTAGSPKKIVLSTDAKKLSPGWDNVAFVRAKIVDANGIEIPRADDLISFKISGPGVIAAVDSANNSSHEPFQATERHAFQGECVAFVKATGSSGKIVLTATAPGLTERLHRHQSRETFKLKNANAPPADLPHLRMHLPFGARSGTHIDGFARRG